MRQNSNQSMLLYFFFNLILMCLYFFINMIFHVYSFNILFLSSFWLRLFHGQPSRQSVSLEYKGWLSKRNVIVLVKCISASLFIYLFHIFISEEFIQSFIWSFHIILVFFFFFVNFQLQCQWYYRLPNWMYHFYHNYDMKHHK